MAQPTSITAHIVLSDKGPETCVATAILAEIIERLQGTVTFDDPSVAIISQSAPSQLDKIWFQVNSQGVVTNIKFFNDATGKWQDVTSTDPAVDPVCLSDGNNALSKVDGCLWLDAARLLQRSTSSNNLIQFDSDGKLIVDITIVKDIAVSLDTEFKCNVLTKNPDTKDLRLKRGAGAYLSLGSPSGDLISGLVLARNVVNSATQTVDLAAAFPSLWTPDCLPTHAQVCGVISIGVGDAFSAGTWASPAAVVEAGFFNSRLCVAVDSDSTEGTVMNTAIVALDPADPKTFSFKVANAASAVDWTNAANEIALYIQGLIYSGLDTP